jgi:hypothetical protein
MDEKKFLENFAKILGSSAQEELKKIEEKKLKEERLLKSFGAALSKKADFEIKIEEEIQPPKQIKLPDEFIKKAPQIIVETPIVHIETISEPVVEEVVVEPPVLEVANLVSQAVSATNVPEDGKKTEADLINASLRKEIEVIKKSVADFHKLVNEQSRKIALAGSSHGGGEINLRYLDDIDRGSIFGGNFLKYNAQSKKFNFANVTSDGVDWLHVPSSIIPEANGIYSLGNSSMRWESLWVGGNSVTFSDQNVSFPDQTLTVANGVFYITDSLNTKEQSNAGFRVGNFLLQNNYIALTNSSSEFYIGTTLATGNLVINRPIVVKSHDTGNTTFSVTREGRVTIFAPSIPAGDIGAMSIIGSANGAYKGVVNPGGMLHITGNDGVVSRITNDGFGTGAFPAYISRAGRGTANTPTAIQSGDIMSRYSTVGWGATNFPLGPAATNIEVYARENFTDAAQGTEYKIFTAPIGTTSKTLSLTINTDGIYSNNITSYSNISGNSATFTGAVYLNGTTTANTLTVNGNTIFNANVNTNANLVINTATVSANLYIGNAGVATKLVISGGANDQILVSNGTTLNWQPRHTDGSWTPVMIPATGSNVVFTVNNGKYVKVGPIVTCHFDIVVSSKGTASGALKLGGLPFTSLAGSAGNYEGTVSMGYFSDLTVADAIHFSGAVNQNSNTADLWLSRLNGQQISQASMNTTDVKITSRFVGTVICTTEF